MLVFFSLLLAFVAGDLVNLAQENNARVARDTEVAPEALAKRQTDSASRTSDYPTRHHKSRTGTYNGTHTRIHTRTHTRTYTGTYSGAYNETDTRTHTRAYTGPHNQTGTSTHKAHENTHRSGHQTPHTSGASESSVSGFITVQTSTPAIDRRFEFPARTAYGNTADRFAHSYSPYYLHLTHSSPGQYLSSTGTTTSGHSTQSYRARHCGFKQRDIPSTPGVSTTGDSSQHPKSLAHPTHNWTSHDHSSYAHHTPHSNHSSHSHHPHSTNSAISGQSTLSTGSLRKRQLFGSPTSSGLSAAQAPCVTTLSYDPSQIFHNGKGAFWTSTTTQPFTIDCHGCSLTIVRPQSGELTNSHTHSWTKTISSVLTVGTPVCDTGSQGSPLALTAG